VPIDNTSESSGDEVFSNIASGMEDYSGYFQTQLPDIESDVPVPINIDAGGGGALLAPAWNGIAVEVGNDSIITRTGRWSSLDSVKNFACNRYTGKKLNRHANELTSSAQGSEGSPCLEDVLAQRTPASAMLTI